MNVIRWIAAIYIMVCLPIYLQAQEKHEPLRKKMQITQNSLSIHSLSGLITAQTKLYLSFNANKVAAEKKIALQKRSYTVEELLELIKANTGIGYKVYQDHIIFQGRKKNGKDGHDGGSSGSQGNKQTANADLAVVKEGFHTNKKETVEKVGVHSAGKKKTSTVITDLTTDKKESSTQNADLSANKKTLTAKITVPSAGKKESGIKIPTNKKGANTIITDSATNKKAYSSANKKESNTIITDPATNKKAYSAANKKESNTTITNPTIHKKAYSDANKKESNTIITDPATNKKAYSSANNKETGTKTENLTTTKATDPTTNTKSKALTPLTTEPPKQLNIASIKAPQIHTTLLYKPTFTGQHQTKPRHAYKASWFVDGGLIIDEIPYLQPTIMGGHPLLHAIISWGTNFQVTGFRYGLSSTIPLKNDWRIGIQVTTGKMERNFNFRGIRDTSKTIAVKSDLHRLALQLEKPLNRRLIIKAGPVFNLLKSSYFQEGNPVTITTSGYAGTNGDREFYTVRPLYTLSNSFKTTESSNTKTWIGFQASLFYRINF